MEDNYKKISVIEKSIDDFMIYASSVIKSRAIPSIEDNLKPIHRRILYVMGMLKLKAKAKPIKVSTISGRIMQFHPHGNSSIDGALIRLSQFWKMRYPLVFVQGNNGNILGDQAAASRYLEARLTPIGELMLENLSSSVVPYVSNYDETEMEPLILTSMFPNILCNGTEGIAVGMSSSLLPHNLSEVLLLLTKMLDNPYLSTEEILKIVPGPDFPMGGTIINGEKIQQAYTTGRGTLLLRAKAEIDKDNNIIFSEFPYLVEVNKIIEQIKKMASDGYDDIVDYENHIGKDSSVIKIILGKKVNAAKVLTDLYDMTSLQKTIKVNNTVITNGVPATINFSGLCRAYLKHQHEIIIAIAKKELEKQLKIIHINEGLELATRSIDQVIAIVRSSDTKIQAGSKLIEILKIDREQADAILSLQLGRLTKLDVNDIIATIEKAKKEKAEQEVIIDSVAQRNKILKVNFKKMGENFGDKRRTTIEKNVLEKEEDKKEESSTGMITALTDGRMILNSPEEFIDYFKKLKPVKWIYNNGHKVYSYDKYGEASSNYTSDSVGLLVMDRDKEFLVTVTEQGSVKKSKLTEYKNIKKLCKIRDKDQLKYAFCCDNDEFLFALMDNEKVIRIPIKDIGDTSKLTIGAKRIKNPTISALVAKEDAMLFTVDNNNKAKLVNAKEFSGTSKVNAGCNYLGEFNDHVYFFTGTMMQKLEEGKMTIRSRSAAGSKISKSDEVIIIE